MPEHSKRMEELARLAAPPEWTMEGKDFAARAKSDREANPAITRELKRRHQTAVAAIVATMQNGAGLPMDRELRYFIAEYNNRLMEYGMHHLPSSFSVAEAFVEFIPAYAYFALRHEADHLMGFSDFLDFATSSDAGDSIAAPMLLQPGVIYSYNNLEPVGDLTFSFDGGKQFSFAGVSMVRHGQEVSLLLLGGVESDLAAESEGVRSRVRAAHPVGEQWRIPAKPLEEHHAEPLLESDRYWKHDLLLRLDLSTKTEQARYVLQDWGGSFFVQTDDAAVLSECEDSDAILAAGLEAVERCAVLFEVAKTCLLLPEYFRFRVKIAREERRPTALATDKRKLSNSLKLKKTPVDQRIFYRRVTSIEIQKPTNAPLHRSYTPPSFKVEVDGFWRRLGPEQVGHDRDGQPVQGRTWVKEHSRWRDRPKRPKVVLVKSSVRAARALAAAAAIEAQEKCTSSACMEPPPDVKPAHTEYQKAGYIYVMSSPALERDIFKIGRTNADPRRRAEDLSKATGVPVQYLVVEDWWVADSGRVETLIHEALKEYRLTDRREFFRAPYKEIRNVIAHVIDGLGK
jgi:hypothetical protein